MSRHYPDWLAEAWQIGFELLRKRKRHSATPVCRFTIDRLAGDRNPVSQLIHRYR